MLAVVELNKLRIEPDSPASVDDLFSRLSALIMHQIIIAPAVNHIINSLTCWHQKERNVVRCPNYFVYVCAI